MKYIYIVNRFQWGEKCDDLIRALRDESKARGREFEIQLNETPEEAAGAARRFRDTHCIVTAIGGDGTINLLLNDLVGTDNILSFIPVGTGNDFYRHCSEKLPDGIHESDIVRINDRYFINAACFGIDADIANDDNFIHNKRIPRPLRYHSGVLYHFLTYRKGRLLRIEWDGQKMEQECTTVVAANARYYGGGYEISPGSVIDDGKMELYVVDPLGKVQTAGIILSMKKAGHLKHPALHMFETDKVTISAPQPFKANIDGETLPADRFELELVPKGIRIELDRSFAERIRQSI